MSYLLSQPQRHCPDKIYSATCTIPLKNNYEPVLKCGDILKWPQNVATFVLGQDGRKLTVSKRLPVDVGKLNPLERLVLPTEELAKVKLRRDFNTGAREFEDYRLKPDLTFEREFDFLSPDDKPVSEMTEEEFEKFSKGLEERLQHDALERELGMRIVTEAEANNVNSLLQNVLSNPHKGNDGQ